MNKEEIVLAAGCFWGVESLFKSLDGVVDTEVGYIGGETLNPTYLDITTGSTGHAEAIKITYDSKIISLDQILHFFFKMHDPTTLNRQGNDEGSQYRSSIFYSNDSELKSAQSVIKEVETMGRFSGPIVTTLEALSTFYSAEEYHQDYLQKNPGGYTCHFIRK